MENISSKQRSKMQKVGKNTKSVLVHEVQAMNNEKEPPSLGIAFDLARESLSCQLEQADALDNKANSLQQLAAPGLVGIDLVLLGVMLPLQRSLWIYATQDLLLIPLLAICATAMFYAGKSNKISTYLRTPKPSALRKYLEEAEDYTKEMILEATIAVFEKNENEIEQKIKMINCTRILFNTELAIFTAVLAIQILLFQFGS